MYFTQITTMENRDLDTLMKEITHIQKNFVSSKKPRRTEDVSRIFAKLIMEGKISAALKFLETKTSKGILSLTDDILEELKEKHPHAATLQEHSLLLVQLITSHQVFFTPLIRTYCTKRLLNTKGAAGPSGMDAELYRRIRC